MQTKLQKFEIVNACETLEELADVIESFADEEGFIKGRTRSFNAKTMANACRLYAQLPKNCLTREFGIRQQAMYILYYTDFAALNPANNFMTFTVKPYNIKPKKK